MARDARRVFPILGLSGTGTVGNLWPGIAGPSATEGVSRKRGEDFRAVRRRPLGMGARKFRWLLPVGAVLSVQAGCKRPETKESYTPANSAIRVQKSDDGVHLTTRTAEFVLSATGNLRASLISGNSKITLEEAGPSAQVTAGNKVVTDFVRDIAHPMIRNTEGKLGSSGRRVEIRGRSTSTGLEETLVLEGYDNFPSVALLSATYKNTSDRDVRLDSISLQSHRLNAALAEAGVKTHEMYAFFGSSLKWGQDDVLPIPAKFAQENPFGTPVETKDDSGRVGGGIPVGAFWTRVVGLAVGHLETLPLAISIPVNTTPAARVELVLAGPRETTLKPRDPFSTPRLFASVYRGDYYEPLHTWSEMVEREGLSAPRNNEESYAVSWCGWGYESDVTPKQMVQTIPKLKQLGIHWATLDDRWFNNYGDWAPRADTFGGAAIQKLVKDFHEQGIKVPLWWLPLACQDGKFAYGGPPFRTS